MTNKLDIRAEVKEYVNVKGKYLIFLYRQGEPIHFAEIDNLSKKEAEEIARRINEPNRIVGIIEEMIKQTGQPNNVGRGNGKVAYIILKELLTRIKSYSEGVEK